MIISLLLILFLYLLQLFTKKINRNIFDYFFKQKGMINDLVLLFSISTFSIIIFFLPSFIENNWFLGHSLTDSFYYTNFSTISLNDNSLLKSNAMIRILDMVTLVVNSFLLFSDTKSTYSITASFLFYLLPFISYIFIRRFFNIGIFNLFAVLLISLTANTYSIFSQSYLGQYLFVIIFIYSILISYIFF